MGESEEAIGNNTSFSSLPTSKPRKAFLKPIDQLTQVPGHQPLFITCASFERDRCLAALAYSERVRWDCTIIVNFTSSTDDEGENRKRETAALLSRQLSQVDLAGLSRQLTVSPQDFHTLCLLIDEELDRRGIDVRAQTITIDISCFTRIQLVFLLRTFMEKGVSRIRLLYATTSNYKTSSDRSQRLTRGSFFPLPVPVRPAPSRRLGGVRRLGIVLLGHEGQRTMAAWRRLDPEETILIFPNSENNRLMQICAKENQFLLHPTAAPSGAISQVGAHYLDSRSVYSALLPRLSKLEKTEYRVSLIPFGPKPLLVGAMLAALAVTGLDFSLMYCIPRGYNSELSRGVDGLFYQDLVSRKATSYTIATH